MNDSENRHRYRQPSGCRVLTQAGLTAATAVANLTSAFMFRVGPAKCPRTCAAFSRARAAPRTRRAADTPRWPGRRRREGTVARRRWPPRRCPRAAGAGTDPHRDRGDSIRVRARCQWLHYPASAHATRRAGRVSRPRPAAAAGRVPPHFRAEGPGPGFRHVTV